MANPYNGSKRGSRGGAKHRPDWDRSVRIAAQRIMDTGSTSKIVAEGKAGYTPAINAHFEGEETPETHIVPRRSITRSQFLANLPQTMEFEALNPIKHMQLVTKGPLKGTMIETTEPNNRQTWKSDKSLLNRSKVDQFGQINRKTGKREDRPIRMTSGSKRITRIPEAMAEDVTIQFDPTELDNDL